MAWRTFRSCEELLGGQLMESNYDTGFDPVQESFGQKTEVRSAVLWGYIYDGITSLSV